MLKTFLKENRSWILLPAAVILLNLGTFWLYRMEMEPFIYGTVLSGPSKSSASAGTAVPGGAGGHGGLLHEMGPSD